MLPFRGRHRFGLGNGCFRLFYLTYDMVNFE